MGAARRQDDVRRERNQFGRVLAQGAALPPVQR
jgi:hypothetical protein